MKKNLFWQKGQSLIELLMAIGLSAILMPAFLIAFSTTRVGRSQQDQRIQAIAYMRETAEALRITRDNAWSNIATDGTYCPQPNGTTWQITPLPTPASTCSQPLAGFTRTITINDAYRVTATNALDPNGTSLIATDYDDPSTKAVTVSVSWSQPINSSVSEVLYFTRHDNLTAVDTTSSDFSSGDTSGGTAVESGGLYGDGAVLIGGGGANDWCAPNPLGIIKYKTSTNGNEVAISAFASQVINTPSYAYTTFGFSANAPALSQWNVSNPPQPTPPVVSTGLTYSPNGEKTYGVYATDSAVLIGSNKNGLSVDIVNPKTNPLSQTGTFVDGSLAGISVYGGYTNSGFKGFATVCTFNTGSGVCTGNNKLDTFPIGGGSLIGSANLSAQGNRVVVVRNLAFVATASTSNQLQIFNVSNPASITPITLTYTSGDIQSKQGGISLAKGATDLIVDNTGTYVYLVTSYVDSSHPDIFKINVSGVTTSSSTANVTIEATQNTVWSGVSMSPLGTILVSQNHLIVVGSGGRQYQVFYSTNLGYCSVNFGAISGATNVKAVSGVSELDGDNYAYILTDDSSNELQIIPGGEGAGGGGGAGSGKGTFISRGLPVPTLAANATFNSYFPIADAPPPTSIGFQLGVAPTCSSAFTFIGPNGTSLSTDTYATSAAIPLSGPAGYQNPGKCFKYKAILNSGGSTTSSPILYQVNVNYSP